VSVGAPGDAPVTAQGAGTGVALPSVRSRLVSGSRWSFGAVAAMLVSGLAGNVLLSRLLAPAELGTYYLTLSAVTTLCVVGRLGLDLAAVRLVARCVATGSQADVRAVVLRTCLLAAGSAAVLGLLLAGGPGRLLAESVFDSPALAAYLPLVGLWAAAEALRQVLSECFRGFHDIRRAMVFGAPAQTVLASLLFALLLLSPDRRDARSTTALACTASLVLLVLAALSLGRRLARLPGGGRTAARTVLAFSLPVMLQTLLSKGLNQADLWVVGASQSAQDVALYGAAARAANLIQTPMFVLGLVLAPIVAEQVALGQYRRLEALLRGASTLLAVPMLVFLLVAAVFGDTVLSVLFGGYYARGQDVLLLLAVGLFAGAVVLNQGTLIMAGHQGLSLLLAAVLTGLTLIAEVLLVGPYGTTGVAAASGAGSVLTAVVFAVAIRRRLGIWVVASLSPRQVRELLAALRSPRGG